jgi:hypothetical protein
MFRLTETVEGSSTVIILEGRLGGPAIEAIGELIRKLETEATSPAPVVLDLREVTGFDSEAKALLAELHARGVTFRAKGCLNRAIVEGITCCGLSSTTEPQGKQVETGGSAQEWTKGGAQ